MLNPARIRGCLALLTLLLCGCQYQPPATWPVQDHSFWRKKENEALKQYASQWHEVNRDADLQLFIRRVVRVDEQTLLLGGNFGDTAGSFRSALLRSIDGGKTWRDTDTWLTGSRTVDIFVLDEHHAWALKCWAIEGDLTPFVVFRTADGGATWERSSQDLPIEPLGIPTAWGLRFASPERGQFWVAESIGRKLHYVTDDGGRNWRLAHRSRVIGEVDAGPDATTTRVTRDEHGLRFTLHVTDPMSGRLVEAGTFPRHYQMGPSGEIMPKP